MIAGTPRSVNLAHDLRDEILKYLPHDRTDRHLADELTVMPTKVLLIWFFNWLNRLVHPHPRHVFKSREYIFRRLGAREQVLLDRLADKIEAGMDVNPHLSRGTKQGFVGEPSVPKRKNLGRRRDLDLLLNDWGVHHLHLSDTLDDDGFVRRDPTCDPDLLLFAIFRDDAAYLLDVGLHGAWTDRSLVEISLRNWPNENLFLPLNGVLAARQDYDRSERRALRSNGMISPISVEGKEYVGPGFMSSAGTTMVAARRASQLWRLIYHLRNL